MDCARIAGTVAHRAHRVARLHPDDELGRGPCRFLREARHARAVSMTRDGRDVHRLVPAFVAVFAAAGVTTGWWLRRGAPMPVASTASAAGPADPHRKSGEAPPTPRGDPGPG